MKRRWRCTVCGAPDCGERAHRPFWLIVQPGGPAPRYIPADAYRHAVAAAFARVRREVWDARESRLRATWGDDWPTYG